MSDEPVAASRIAKVLDAPSGRGRAGALAALAQEYAADERGFQLREVAGGWRLYTHPAYHDIVDQYVLSWDTRRLSQAALEALAVVAYHQPVSRQGVNAVRGVNSEGVIASLIEKGLVREVGRDKAAGNAILYGTTRTFLERFGLKDLAELPPLEDFSPDPDTERAIRDRLSATEGPVLGGDRRGGRHRRGRLRCESAPVTEREPNSGRADARPEVPRSRGRRVSPGKRGPHHRGTRGGERRSGGRARLQGRPADSMWSPSTAGRSVLPTPPSTSR